jgi:hypothetical protein
MRKYINNLIGAVGLTCSLANVNELVNFILCILSIIVLLTNFVISIKDKYSDGKLDDKERKELTDEAKRLQEEIEKMRGDKK